MKQIYLLPEVENRLTTVLKKIKRVVITHFFGMFPPYSWQKPQEMFKVPESMKTNTKHIVNILLTSVYQLISLQIVILSRTFWMATINNQLHK